MAITQAQLDAATGYNEAQLEANKLTARHVSALALLWQQQNNLLADGKAGPDTVASIEAWLTANVGTSTSTSPIPGVAFYDRRKYAAQSHGGYAVTQRSINDVTGICLHQTACNLGERVERWDTVGAHFGLTRGLKIIWLHDYTHKVAAANGWNNGTISIEVDGLYAGVEGDPSTVWNDPSTPEREQGQVFTPQMADVLRKWVRWVKADIERGSSVGRVNALVAHRQSSKDRESDPGSAIWSVAVELHKELNMSDGGVGFTVSGGLPIPEAWDPRCKGYRY